MTICADYRLTSERDRVCSNFCHMGNYFLSVSLGLFEIGKMTAVGEAPDLQLRQMLSQRLRLRHPMRTVLFSPDQGAGNGERGCSVCESGLAQQTLHYARQTKTTAGIEGLPDRKSTRLNSSHSS